MPDNEWITRNKAELAALMELDEPPTFEEFMQRWEPWGSHPYFLLADWQADVAAGDERSGSSAPCTDATHSMHPPAGLCTDPDQGRGAADRVIAGET